MSNIANFTGEYQPTLSGVIMPQVNEQMQLSMSAILDNTDTLANEITVVGQAGRNEAKAKKKQLWAQGVGQFAQAGGQIAGAVATGWGTYKGGKATADLDTQMGTFEDQRVGLEKTQKDFQGAALKDGRSAEMNFENYDLIPDEELTPEELAGRNKTSAIKSRSTQFATGDFGPATPKAQEQWLEAQGIEQLPGETPEAYQACKATELANLDSETMLHMAEAPEGQMKDALGSLENKILGLNEQITKLSNKATREQTTWNNKGSIVKDLASAFFTGTQGFITGVSARWSTQEIMNQNVASMAQMMLQTLEKILQQFYEGLSKTTQEVEAAAQINASSAV